MSNLEDKINQLNQQIQGLSTQITPRDYSAFEVDMDDELTALKEQLETLKLENAKLKDDKNRLEVTQELTEKIPFVQAVMNYALFNKKYKFSVATSDENLDVPTLINSILNASAGLEEKIKALEESSRLCKRVAFEIVKALESPEFKKKITDKLSNDDCFEFGSKVHKLKELNAPKKNFQQSYKRKFPGPQ